MYKNVIPNNTVLGNRNRLGFVIIISFIPKIIIQKRILNQGNRNGCLGPPHGYAPYLQHAECHKTFHNNLSK